MVFPWFSHCFPIKNGDFPIKNGDCLPEGNPKHPMWRGQLEPGAHDPSKSVPGIRGEAPQW